MPVTRSRFLSARTVILCAALCGCSTDKIVVGVDDNNAALSQGGSDAGAMALGGQGGNAGGGTNMDRSGMGHGGIDSGGMDQGGIGGSTSLTSGGSGGDRSFIMMPPPPPEGSFQRHSDPDADGGTDQQFDPFWPDPRLPPP